MTRSELIDLMASQQSQLTTKDVELAVKLMIDHMAESLHRVSALRFVGLEVFRCITASLVKVETPRRVIL